MLNPTYIVSAAYKSNVLTIPKRKECCEPLWTCQAFIYVLFQSRYLFVGFLNFRLKRKKICILSWRRFSDKSWSRVLKCIEQLFSDFSFSIDICNFCNDPQGKNQGQTLLRHLRPSLSACFSSNEEFKSSVNIAETDRRALQMVP